MSLPRAHVPLGAKEMLPCTRSPGGHGWSLCIVFQKLLPLLLSWCFLGAPTVALAASAVEEEQLSALPPSSFTAPLGSTFLPLDSWEYLAMERLISMGYVGDAYLGLRPWTRDSFVQMLRQADEHVRSEGDTSQANMAAEAMVRQLTKAFAPEIAERANNRRPPFTTVDRLYVLVRGIGGAPLSDSYHFGQTIVNDEGRLYGEGVNSYGGFLAHAGEGRFSLQVRGEYQHARGRAAYPTAALQAITDADEVPAQGGAVKQTNVFRLLEANASVRLVGHEISVGKGEDWWGPANGGAMAWSNNAEPIYALRINRVNALFIPGLSRILGPFRYEALFGSLRGQTFPHNPWVQAQKIAFKPTSNLEFGFSRVAVFAGGGHVPLTFGSFWRSFTGFSNVSPAEKNSRLDPGARHSSFDFSYRLPFVRDWATLYTDSIVHDDTSPVDAPRHAAVRPGLFLSHLPGASQLTLRVEGALTDPPTSRSDGGKYIYWEGQYRQVYTNKGNIFGDWVGREGKGGQAWLTWWLRPQQNVQLEYRNAKAAKDFIAGGTTENVFGLSTMLRLRANVELRANVQGEVWSVPVLATGKQNDVSATVQVTLFPSHGTILLNNKR